MRSGHAFKNMPLLLGVKPEGISTYPKKSGLLALLWDFFLKQISKKREYMQ